MCSRGWDVDRRDGVGRQSLFTWEEELVLNCYALFHDVVLQPNVPIGGG
jgi:hypothetical protein